MKLEEFKKQLLIEPHAQDEEILTARRASTEHMAAAKAADQFEEKLGAAMRPPADPELVDQILNHSMDGQESASGGRWRWAAMAAAIVVSVGMAYVFLDRPLNVPLRQAFVDHFHYNEPKALTSTEPVDESRVKQLFARYGADLATDVGGVTFLSPCRIGGKKGLHMVITQAEGQQITVMFLPDETLAETQEFAVDQVPARMDRTAIGVLALFGHHGQDLEDLSTRLVAGLRGIRVATLID